MHQLERRVRQRVCASDASDIIRKCRDSSMTLDCLLASTVDEVSAECEIAPAIVGMLKWDDCAWRSSWQFILHQMHEAGLNGSTIAAAREAMLKVAPAVQQLKGVPKARLREAGVPLAARHFLEQNGYCGQHPEPPKELQPEGGQAPPPDLAVDAVAHGGRAAASPGTGHLAGAAVASESDGKGGSDCCSAASPPDDAASAAQENGPSHDGVGRDDAEALDAGYPAAAAGSVSRASPSPGQDDPREESRTADADSDAASSGCGAGLGAAQGGRMAAGGGGYRGVQGRSVGLEVELHEASERNQVGLCCSGNTGVHAKDRVSLRTLCPLLPCALYCWATCQCQMV